MEIVRREELTTVFELKNVENNIHWIIKHFLYCYDEVLYFVEDDFLRAVVSVNDIFKYLEGKKPEIINRNFTYILEDDPDRSREFFFEHPTIHELPLVNFVGGFTGVVKSGERNPERLWDKFRLHIKAMYFDIYKYYQKLSEQFIGKFNGKVFLISLPNDNSVLERINSSCVTDKFKKRHVFSPLKLLQNMTEQEEKDFWGAAYQPGISRAFANEFSKIRVKEKNGCKYYENSELTHYISFDNGKRNVVNRHAKAERKIFLVGPCTIFGAYVTDDQTVEYYLQQFVNQDDYSFQVVNFGALGLYYEFQYLLTECIRNDDIVVVASQNRKLISIMKQYGNVCYLGDYSDIFDVIDNPLSCILDTFRHVNYKVSKEIAKRIFMSIKPDLSLSNEMLSRREEIEPIQDYFISWDIVTYYKEFAMTYDLYDLHGVVGAIVMNCNPFTKGHRYLIEYAAKKVDTLIIFVVEEDASVFSFDDRMKMVRMGTEDMPNVRVVPSGKYNISKSTFAQYFEKEKFVEQVDSMDYDLRIFCEVIADCMNISCRFAGEEPTDAVTRKYNETMKHILPQYGIKFTEIPRLRLKEEECISASKVREYLNHNDWTAVADFVPETTMRYLQNRKC